MIGESKLKMLQELLVQMQTLMADGQGDDPAAGKEAMEELDEGADEAALSSDEEPMVSGSGDDEDMEETRKAFFQRSGKLAPKKSSMLMGAADSKRPMPQMPDLKKSRKFA